MTATVKLVPNETYFMVVFEDEGLTLPIIQTLQFVGERTREDGSRYYLFTELHSDADPTSTIIDVSDAGAVILDRNGLIDKLSRCFAGELSKPPK